MEFPAPPSSQGSEDAQGRSDAGQGRPSMTRGENEIGSLRVGRPNSQADEVEDEDDGFDSEEFREWMRSRKIGDDAKVAVMAPTGTRIVKGPMQVQHRNGTVSQCLSRTMS